jgi:DNA repair protein Rad10
MDAFHIPSLDEVDAARTALGQGSRVPTTAVPARAPAPHHVAPSAGTGGAPGVLSAAARPVAAPSPTPLAATAASLGAGGGGGGVGVVRLLSVPPDRPPPPPAAAPASAASSSSAAPLVLRRGPDANSFGEAFSLFADAGGLGKVVDLEALVQARRAAAATGGGGGGAHGEAGAGASSSSSSLARGFAGAARPGASGGGGGGGGGAPKLQMQVNPKQKGNPVLQYITNVWWDYVEGLSGGGGGGPDFVVGSGAAALYLSLKYHLLHPDYIHKRTRGLSRDRYKLRVLLVLVSGARGGGRGRERGWGGEEPRAPRHCANPDSPLYVPPQIDVEDCDKPLGELNKLALHSEYTMMCVCPDIYPCPVQQLCVCRLDLCDCRPPSLTRPPTPVPPPPTPYPLPPTPPSPHPQLRLQRPRGGAVPRDLQGVREQGGVRDPGARREHLPPARAGSAHDRPEVRRRRGELGGEGQLSRDSILSPTPTPTHPFPSPTPPPAA